MLEVAFVLGAVLVAMIGVCERVSVIILFYACVRVRECVRERA